jgi:DNA invertase Pin-like site-specific DNA recombinase
MVYGYCRVSTLRQAEKYGLEYQKKAILERYPEARIIEESISSAKLRNKFEELINTAGEGDHIIVNDLTRFCRSVREGLEYVQKLVDRNVRFTILNMGTFENTPMGRYQLTNMLAYAQFERDMIVLRCQNGRALAREQPGYKEGRKKKFSKQQIKHALELLEDHTQKQVEDMTGISVSTLKRAKMTARAEKVN